MLKCAKLTIEGKMVLEAGVVFEGEVKVVNAKGEAATLKAGTYTGTVEL